MIMKKVCVPRFAESAKYESRNGVRQCSYPPRATYQHGASHRGRWSGRAHTCIHARYGVSHRTSGSIFWRTWYLHRGSLYLSEKAS